MERRRQMQMQKTKEQELAERIAPMVEERIKYDITRGIIEAIEERFYPPEEMMREEFIEEVQKEINETKPEDLLSFEDLQKNYSKEHEI